jgi:predicted phosphoribosyltransferase
MRWRREDRHRREEEEEEEEEEEARESRQVEAKEARASNYMRGLVTGFGAFSAIPTLALFQAITAMLACPPNGGERACLLRKGCGSVVCRDSRSSSKST